jgi:hypothetical protein
MQEGIGSGSNVGVGPAKEKLRAQYRRCYAAFQALWLLLGDLVRKPFCPMLDWRVPSMFCQ